MKHTLLKRLALSAIALLIAGSSSVQSSLMEHAATLS